MYYLAMTKSLKTLKLLTRIEILRLYLFTDRALFLYSTKLHAPMWTG